MLLQTGAQVVVSDVDFIARCGLLGDELGMAGRNVPQMLASVRDAIGGTELAAAVSAAQSDSTIELIQRFARTESNLDLPGTTGLGRISATGFPRVGGVLAKEAQKRQVSSLDLQYAVERTMHAGYLATLLLAPAVVLAPLVSDAEQVWERWIVSAYMVRDEDFDEVASLCAFDEFWLRCFDAWGLTKARTTFSKGGPIARSLGGLAGTGIALAVAERQTETAGHAT